MVSRSALLLAAGAIVSLLVAACGSNATPLGDNAALRSVPTALASPCCGSNPHWVFIADTTADAVDGFDFYGTGNVAPLQMLQGSNTGLTAPQAVQLALNGQIYVGDTGPGGPNIKVYKYLATGNTAPIRTITSSSMTDNPVSLALDRAADIFVAAGTNGVLEFAAGANGSSTPVAIIAGPDTGLTDVIAVDIDKNGNVFALDGPSHAVREFPAGSNGDAAPIRTIMGSKTQLANAVDLRVTSSAQDQVYVSDGHQLIVFGGGKNGNVKPSSTATIVGYSRVLGLQIHDRYVEFSALADSDGSPALVQLPRAPSGPTAPFNVIDGSNTGLMGLGKITIHETQ